MLGICQCFWLGLNQRSPLQQLAARLQQPPPTSKGGSAHRVQPFPNMPPTAVLCCHCHCCCSVVGMLLLSTLVCAVGPGQLFSAISKSIRDRRLLCVHTEAQFCIPASELLGSCSPVVCHTGWLVCFGRQKYLCSSCIMRHNSRPGGSLVCLACRLRFMLSSLPGPACSTMPAGCKYHLLVSTQHTAAASMCRSPAHVACACT